MSENDEVKSKRDLALERMKTKYPDKSFDDDESFFGQINDDYDDYDRRLGESDQRIADLEGREKAFSDMFTSDPRSARFMMDWKNGKDPVVSLISMYGEDFLEAKDDPERQEAIAAANKEFAERMAKEAEYEEQYTNNLDESLRKLDEMAQERGLSDEDVDGAMETLMSICKDALLGKFSTETVDMILKAKNYDADVKQASHEGEVTGRNKKIRETLRKSKKGDGTAQLDGKSGGDPTPKPKRDLGALDRFGDESDDIWTRGNEKRTARR